MTRCLPVLLIVLLLPASVLAAKAERIVDVEEATYLVEYVYDPMGTIFVPSTLPLGQAHYDATITVYRIGEGKREQIATFSGQYTAHGCFEDDPAMLAQKALKRAEENEPGER